MRIWLLHVVQHPTLSRYFSASPSRHHKEEPHISSHIPHEHVLSPRIPCWVALRSHPSSPFVDAGMPAQSCTPDHVLAKYSILLSHIQHSPSNSGLNRLYWDIHTSILQENSHMQPHASQHSPACLTHTKPTHTFKNIAHKDLLHPWFWELRAGKSNKTSRRQNRCFCQSRSLSQCERDQHHYTCADSGKQSTVCCWWSRIGLGQGLYNFIGRS